MLPAFPIIMPYKRNRDLPDTITSSLPDEAQTLFRKAFNSAHEQYDSESRAMKTAWSAVKKKYHKTDNGAWERDSS